MLAHKDFLASATEAVSQRPRPDFSESCVCRMRLLFSSRPVANFLGNLLQTTSPPFSEYEDILLVQIIKDFPPRIEAEVLVSAFFSYAEANCYYLDETAFRGQLSRFYDNGLTWSIADSKFICLTLTIFSMGSQFAYLVEPALPVDSEALAGVFPGTKFFQYAQSLIPRILGSPSLEGVLSCLLLGLYALPVYNTGTCYTYLGLALRISVYLGLHRKPELPFLSPTLMEIRNRIFWTTYTIERYGPCRP